ncbi:Uncharacterised protein [Metamycoplasma cloacale]|uniref:Uncharacterized protein n=1 Tax=Metamycoplasma cloacale TaxID=92401 RepID=A0A2Z4LLD6_9BACT|nr:DUF31 family protein [Metamycoplasma cloacale]AWX42571.1 hypothetical protein DK849_00525 [Metamycoplasma cloacale]VEU79724.1 Uncharacterised protein [Metamycoplasma cloacale]
MKRKLLFFLGLPTVLSVASLTSCKKEKVEFEIGEWNNGNNNNSGDKNNPNHPVTPTPKPQPQPETPVTPTPQPQPETPEGENNVQPNPQPNPEEIPEIPSFPFPNFYTNDSYPEYVNRYNEISANNSNPELTKNSIYKEIYDRSFSIQTVTRLNEPGNPLLAIDQGTGWVLDYSWKNEEHTEISLFIATNFHVLSNFSNSWGNENDKKLGYDDPSGNTVAGFALGKASLENFDFGKTLNNKTNINAGVEYISNIDILTNPSLGFRGAAHATTHENSFNNPVIIFAGIDYIDDFAYNQFAEDIKTKFNVFKQNNYNNYKAIIDWQNERNEKIPFYTDFGVIKLDVNLATASSKMNTWIQNAVNAVNQYINRTKTLTLPNIDVTESYLPTLDYLSKGKNLSNNNPVNSYALSNAKNLYIAGYPRDTNGRTYFAKNNPTERDSDEISYFKIKNNKTAFTYSKNDASTRMGDSMSIYPYVWNRLFVESYGFNYNIKFSSLYYGASGSVVYNDFGEIVGIYNGVSSSVQFGDLLKSATMAPLLQSEDILLDNGKTIYAYNLIDGSNKNKYPHQTTSYREQLIKLYGENNLKTALFPNGVNK